MQDWLSHRVQATPNRTALVRTQTGETLDFAGLDEMVDDLAKRLVAVGVEAGDHLGLLMETRLAAVCTIYAAERLGAVLVPVGADLTSHELHDRFENADVTVVVCSTSTEAMAVETFEGPVCSVDETDHDRVLPLGSVTPADATPAEWGLSDVRLLLFTSGTTGEPKVVRLTHGNLLWSAVASALRLGLDHDDRWLVCLSLHHMGGLSPVLRLPLYGTTVVLQESFDAGRTADNIGNYDVSCVSLVPTMLKRMLDLRGTLADTLRVVLLGGAPAPEKLLRRCRDFSVPVHPTYGMTETASQVATAGPKEAFANVGTVGRPLFWTSVSLHDEDGTVDEPGENGELVVDGPTVSPGYYNDSAATEAAFGPHGLHTGDVGYRDEDGRLYIVGRVDDSIITGGENVYPREVEDALVAHPDVTEVAVVGIPDEEWGEVVGALIVASDDVTVDALGAHCRDRLAPFKLPRVISFTDELPRTASGTVERERARQLLEEGTEIPDAEMTARQDDESVGGPDAEQDASQPEPDAQQPVDPAAAEETEVLIEDAESDPQPEDADEAFLVANPEWDTTEESGDPVDTEATVDTEADASKAPPDFLHDVIGDDFDDTLDNDSGDTLDNDSDDSDERPAPETADDESTADDTGAADDTAPDDEETEE